MQVRWDAVVDRSLWDIDTASPPLRESERAAAKELRAHVRLFGSLDPNGRNRSFDLTLPQPAFLQDVFRLLAQELGEEFLPRVLDPLGRKHSYCRLFVDGVAVDDANAPLPTSAETAQIEIVLLMGMEGG